jgi:hypothetical protein
VSELLAQEAADGGGWITILLPLGIGALAGAVWYVISQRRGRAEGPQPEGDGAVLRPRVEASPPITPVSVRRDRIFISYRREDTQGYARALREVLVDQLGTERVFRDIDTVRPGQDFVDEVNRALSSSAVVVALIGSKWLEATDSEGQPRLTDELDHVRVEIASALRLGTFVLPVLVQGAAMPRSKDLPEDLRPLVRINALELSDTRWDFDIERLVEVVRERIDARA